MATGKIQNPFSIVETGTSNGWTYWLYADNTVVATRTIATTLTNYATVGSFYGYTIANISTPFTMTDVDYYVGCDWSVGTGFSIPAGRLNRSTTGFNAYCLSSGSGTVAVSLRMHLIGKKA